MADRERMMEALRNADAAGDTESAQRIAQMIRNGGQQQPDMVRLPVSRGRQHPLSGGHPELALPGEGPPLEIDITDGPMPEGLPEPRQGVGAGLQRTGWNIASRLPGIGLAERFLPEGQGPLDQFANALGAQESLQDFRNVASLPQAQVRPEPQGAELGVFQHYNPETGQIDYPMEDVSNPGAIGRGVLGGVAAGAGGIADLLNAPNVAFQNAFVAPFTGAAPQPYDANMQNFRGALVDRGLIPESVTDLPEDRRAAYFGGEALGASVPIAGGMGVADRARRGAQVGRLQQGTARPMRGDTREMFDPRQFGGFGVQAGSAVGAGIGAAAGETVAPGDPNVRMASEIIGSIFHPTHLGARAIEAGGGIKASIDRLVSGGGFSREALQDRGVQRALVDNIRRSGEDPEQVLAALRANRGGELSEFTSDVLTGSVGLRNMANYLRRQNPDFTRQIDTKNQTAWEVLMAAADKEATSGAPEAIQSAARLYRSAFEDMFQAQARAAEQRSVAAARQLGDGGPEQMRRAGEYMSEVTNDAYRAAKEFETAAWRSVPTDMQITPSATQQMLGGASSRVRDIQAIIPSDLRGFTRIVADGQPVTSDEMREFYFALRDSAATYRAAGEGGHARRIGQIADSIIDDMAAVPNFSAARVASRELHAAFSDTFVSDLLNTGAFGSARYGPTVAAGKAIAGGASGTQRLQRADELRAAAAHDPNVGLARGGQTLPDVPDAAATAAAAKSRSGGMQEALEQANLARLQGAVDPQTGRAQPGTLARRLGEAETLDVPASQHLGREALSSEQAAQRTAQRSADRMTRLDNPQESTLARVLNREGQTSTADIVDSTLRRADAASEYARIARVAGNRRLSEEVRTAAMDDLRAGTINSVLKRAGGSQGPFGVDMVKARRGLLESPGQGRPSTMDLMERNGVITAAHAQRMRQFFTRASEAQTTLANTSADIDVASPSAWFDTLARIGGAKIGGQAAQRVFGGTDIQTPGIMARLFQRALRAMPQYNPQQAMMHVVMDPNALETALEAAMRHQGNRLSLLQASRMRKTTAGMLQAGLIPKEAYDEILVEIDAAQL